MINHQPARYGVTRLAADIIDQLRELIAGSKDSKFKLQCIKEIIRIEELRPQKARYHNRSRSKDMKHLNKPSEKLKELLSKVEGVQ